MIFWIVCVSVVNMIFWYFDIYFVESEREFGGVGPWQEKFRYGKKCWR